MKILFLLLLVIFLFGNAGHVSAITFEDIESTKAAVMTYKLPWPGILPDHPLYKIKVARNKLILKLLRTEEKKLEFYLLEADKGIYAASLLVDKGKIELARETALKGEHNYTELAAMYKWMYWYKKPIAPALEMRIFIAPLKHQELLDGMIAKVPASNKKIFEQVKEFSQRNLNELIELTKKKEDDSSN